MDFLKGSGPSDFTPEGLYMCPSVLWETGKQPVGGYQLGFQKQKNFQENPQEEGSKLLSKA